MTPVLEAQDAAGPESKSKMELEVQSQKEGEGGEDTSEPELNPVDQAVKETCNLLEQLSKGCVPFPAPAEEPGNGGGSKEESEVEATVGPSGTGDQPQGGQKGTRKKRRNPGSGEECSLQAEEFSAIDVGTDKPDKSERGQASLERHPLGRGKPT